jgi:large subunit ribosomal protein L4
MKTSIYNSKGKSAGEVTLPDAVFAQSWNGDLVHQVLHAITANTRAGTADTKGRAEVRGGGKKPWKQKGTGRARHGSSRSPIWKGGGVTHGPLAEKNYKQKVNKKMSAKALATVLSAKFRDGEVLFVDSLSLGKVPKTADAAEMVQVFAGIKGFEKLAKARKPKAMMIIPTIDKTASQSFRNIPQITLGLVKDVNTFDLLNHQYVIVVDPELSIANLEKRCAHTKAK